VPLISAHRCGAAGQPRFDNTRAGVERALEGDAEYVELDVQRCGDGALVLRHDDFVVRDGRRARVDSLTRAEVEEAAGETCSLEAALAILAGHKLAHIDLKFTSPAALYDAPERTAEVGAARSAQAIMGTDGFVITSLEDRSVGAVRDWADAEGLAFPVGLSLGRGLRETPWLARPGVRLSELAPARRIAASRANLVVAHRRIARLGVARWAARQPLPLLVWTVDDPRSLRAWLSDPRVWLLTSNQPELACRIRDELSRRRLRT
jgi:glycerophosphoryl diester phosphodiesterase